MTTPEIRLLLLVFAGLFGLLLGSFLNACIFRLPRNCMSVAKGRSHCPRCRALIAWHDNIPVLSWILLGGKCRHCRQAISPRYVLVELLTAALVAWLAWGRLYPGSLAASMQSYAVRSLGYEAALLWGAQVYLTAALIVSAFIDFEFRILPDEINYSGLALGIVLCCAFPWLHLGRPLTLSWPFVDEPLPLALKIWPWAAALAASLWGAGVGAGITYLVRVAGGWIFRKEAMGMGDVKLLGFLGAWLGWRAALILFILGSFYGTVYALIQFPLSRKLRGVEIWFGPFLALGALTMIFAGGVADRAIEAYVQFFRR